MNATKEPKMSKEGWPLGKYNHRLGAIMVDLFPALASRLRISYGIEVEFVPFSQTSSHGDVVTLPVRLSMERYGQIRAFIDGYKAASY